jgi:hypothetical protein
MPRRTLVLLVLVVLSIGSLAGRAADLRYLLK